MNERHQIIVVGAGQAGLAMSRRLTERSIDHVVLERGQIRFGQARGSRAGPLDSADRGNHCVVIFRNPFLQLPHRGFGELGGLVLGVTRKARLDARLFERPATFG